MGLKIQKSKKKWYRGKVECDFQFNYNLMWLLLPFVIIALLIKFLFEGIAWVIVKIFDAVTWCFRWVKYFVLLLWNWLKKNEKWWWLFIPLLLWLFVTVRSCDGNKEDVKPFDIEQQEIIYENSWDDVVVVRAYLDNVQSKIEGTCPRVLVGFKFINGKPAKEFNFEGKTYDEAVKIVSESWKPFVLDNVKVNLNPQQMTVVILTAMRMGEAGFKRSTFLQKINQEEFVEASNWFVLQDENGNIIKTGDEPKKYFKVLQLMWNTRVTADELIDFPIWSYLQFDLNREYTEEEMIEIMMQGNNPTPREALGLN